MSGKSTWLSNPGSFVAALFLTVCVFCYWLLAAFAAFRDLTQNKIARLPGHGGSTFQGVRFSLGGLPLITCSEVNEGIGMYNLGWPRWSARKLSVVVCLEKRRLMTFYMERTRLFFEAVQEMDQCSDRPSEFADHFRLYRRTGECRRLSVADARLRRFSALPEPRRPGRSFRFEAADGCPGCSGATSGASLGPTAIVSTATL
jgi:hypothetical protein